MQAPLQARNDSDAARTDTARTVAQKRVLADNRPEAVAQRNLAEVMNNSPHVSQQRALSKALHNSPRMVAQRNQMNVLFGGAVKPQRDGAMPAEASPAQHEEKINKTGLPNQLKSGIESLSGMSMDHVTVHYNSEKPAQLQAHAYAQGSEIHLGAGQERHLPHEAWHVVQQAQGRVRPTLQMKADAVNDDASLEKEADAMGRKAAQLGGDHIPRKVVASEGAAAAVAQRVAVVIQAVKIAKEDFGARKIGAMVFTKTSLELIERLNTVYGDKEYDTLDDFVTAFRSDPENQAYEQFIDAKHLNKIAREENAAAREAKLTTPASAAQKLKGFPTIQSNALDHVIRRHTYQGINDAGTIESDATGDEIAVFPNNINVTLLAEHLETQELQWESRGSAGNVQGIFSDGKIRVRIYAVYLGGSDISVETFFPLDNNEQRAVLQKMIDASKASLPAAAQ